MMMSWRTSNSKVHGHKVILLIYITPHSPILVAKLCGVHSQNVRSTSVCFT